MIWGADCKRLILNKNTKIWLNYLIGIAISSALLWGIYLQIKKQVSSIDTDTWLEQGITSYLILSILLMPLNLGIEAYKWKILANTAQPISYKDAFKSVLGGIALSLVTPNRIGEYPGRILYLKRKNTVRLISVAILAAFAQFLTVFIFGNVGLVYYNFRFPGNVQLIILAASLVATILVALIFFHFERWAKLFERVKWLKRFKTYGHLLRRFTVKEQLLVLGLSGLRFIVFTAQYLILLHWMNINLSALDGLCMAFLFFWAIAVIPSIALAELGIRGQISLFLFHKFSQNTMGILAATIGLWGINLIIPAVIGCILLIRMRVVR